MGLIDDLAPIDSLAALARAKVKGYVDISVPVARLGDMQGAGWVLLKQGKVSIRLRREKVGHELLCDRVWSLLYRVGVILISSGRSGELRADLDLVAVDSEVAIACVCVSNEKYGRARGFRQTLEALASMRAGLSKEISKAHPAGFKRNFVLCVFVENVDISDEDKEFAESRGIVIFDETDLGYYEKLVGHLGPAAKYQFYAEMLPGKTIPGLEIKVPAVRTKMGPKSCLTFPISPEYLLKIAYISHRSKGKASDVHTYQRMLNKGRLKRIREYISDQGVFPTNIVVNIDKRYLSFERVQQQNDRASMEVGGVLGWLTIRPAYKAAWVIDGQHRLFAYSGHEYARAGHLSVLAFEGISTSAQANMFVDINAKQKSVSPSLLQELFAELHWDADSPSIRVQAIISKAVQTLDGDRDSPFCGRIQMADVAKDSIRCISLASLYRALERHSFFVEREEGNLVTSPGPFWKGANESSLGRTVFILKKWFGEISDAASEWWGLGSAPGGGLSMNDSVVAGINVLWSVLEHVKRGRGSLSNLDNKNLWLGIEPYAQALGRHFGRMSIEERSRYRELRGSQGQVVRTRRAQQAIREEISEFSPQGLEEFLGREKAQTNLKGKEVIDRLEIIVQKLVVDELKQEYGADDSGWWTLGVPKAIRTDVVGRMERDDNKRKSKEAYFELIEYRTIAQSQWTLFQPVLGLGRKSESKDKQTKWLSELNEMRRIVAHSSSGVTLAVEQLEKLHEIERELKEKKRRSVPVYEEISEEEEVE